MQTLIKRKQKYKYYIKYNQSKENYETETLCYDKNYSTKKIQYS